MTTEYDFKKIYAEYYEKIVQYLVRITGPNDAEDIAQDVFACDRNQHKYFQKLPNNRR